MEKAKELLAQGKLEEARSLINGVLSRDPRDVNALLLRSTLRTRTGELAGSLSDAEAAVRLSKGSAESQLRRAIALWRTQEYGKAKHVAKFLDDSQAATMWKSMIAARPEPEEAVAAIPEAVDDKPETLTTSTGTGAAATVPPQQPPQPPTVSGAVSAPQSPRVDWYQSGDVVHVTLYRKGLQDASTDVKIGDTELAVRSTVNEFSWTLSLGHSILADASTYEITPYKVEFTLKKATDVRWGSLESSAEDTAQKPAASRPTPQTSYSKWEHIDADDDDEKEKKDSDPNAFFQELYKTATPEVQRAMMKSYVESNGTALSTNWDEVKKGKVETQPPKDMEARSWN